MRIRRKKIKVFSNTLIPERLSLFFQHVDGLIKKGCETTKVSGDDLIQNEYAYGGLLEDDGHMFGFTYFVGSGTNGKWELTLSRAQISEIANSKVQSLGLWSCTAENCKFSSMSEDDLCIDCDYDEVDPPVVPVPESPLNEGILRAFKIELSSDKLNGNHSIENIIAFSPLVICRLTNQVSELEGAIKDLKQIVNEGNSILLKEIQKVTSFEWVGKSQYEDTFLKICSEMLSASLYRLEWEKNK